MSKDDKIIEALDSLLSGMIAQAKLLKVMSEYISTIAHKVDELDKYHKLMQEHEEKPF